MHPLLVTGLKAWHLRQGHAFLTVSNTEECMKALPDDTREIVFVCGEIDCREGLPGAVEKKKYPTMAAAVDATVQAYVQAIDALAATYKVDVKVLTVMPPCNPKVARRVCVCVCVLARARARAFMCVYVGMYLHTPHTHAHTHTHTKTHISTRTGSTRHAASTPNCARSLRRRGACSTSSTRWWVPRASPRPSSIATGRI